MDKQQVVDRIKTGTKILIWVGVLALFAYSFQIIIDFDEITHPSRQKQFIRILAALSKPNFEGEVSRLIVDKMWETIQIALIATTISAVIAVPITFLSARPSLFWKRGFNAILQPILSAVRAVHPLIITILVAVLAGIGPTAGVLALTLFSIAVLVENFTDYCQQHTSLSWSILFRVHFPGLAFKRLPINILIATVLGIFGGGGIGSYLEQYITLLNYRDAGAAILACIIAIGSLDLLSRAVWHKIQNSNASQLSTPETKNLH